LGLFGDGREQPRGIVGRLLQVGIVIPEGFPNIASTAGSFTFALSSLGRKPPNFFPGGAACV
jgi:hypothetical protein